MAGEKRKKQHRLHDTSPSLSSPSTASDSDYSLRRQWQREKEQLRKSEGGSKRRREKEERRRKESDRERKQKKRVYESQEEFTNVNNDSKQTRYDQYRLREMQTGVGEASRDRMRPHYGTTKLEWESVAGDKPRRRVYGIDEDLSLHPRRRVTPPTRESRTPPTSGNWVSQQYTDNERLNQELVTAACEEVAQVRQLARSLEATTEAMMAHINAFKRQLGIASTRPI